MYSSRRGCSVWMEKLQLTIGTWLGFEVLGFQACSFTCFSACINSWRAAEALKEMDSNYSKHHHRLADEGPQPCTLKIIHLWSLASMSSASRYMEFYSSNSLTHHKRSMKFESKGINKVYSHYWKAFGYLGMLWLHAFWAIEQMEVSIVHPFLPIN